MPEIPAGLPIFFKNTSFVNRELTLGTNKVRERANTNTIPSWNNLGRPTSVKIGTIGFNVELEALEFWTGSNWVNLKMERI